MKQFHIFSFLFSSNIKTGKFSNFINEIEILLTNLLAAIEFENKNCFLLYVICFNVFDNVIDFTTKRNGDANLYTFFPLI